MNFRSLASSSAGCCYLLSAGDDAPLLIECGIPLRQIRERTLFGIADLAGCIVSHEHLDHSQSAKPLMTCAVNVYAPVGVFERLGCAGHHRAKAIAGGSVFDVGAFTVMAFDAVHDVETLGFVVCHREGKLLYLTDTAYSRYRIDGLTHIAVECNYSRDLLMANTMRGDIHTERFKRTVRNHMRLERLLEMLKANDLSQVQEIHLLHLSDANSDEAEFADTVRRATGVPVYVAAKDNKEEL
jgi:phosphoribosyl 1,2-cyclic phosphodiesterase